MTPSFIVVSLGAVAAIVATAGLAARCARAPRLFMIAWAVAIFCLAIAMASQALGHLTGYSGPMFRAMELAGLGIAPLALCLALVEVAGRSTPARFAMRLATSAILVVVVVILGTDPLNSTARFSKTFPDPSVFYELIPKGLIELVAALTLVTALVTGVLVAYRSSRGPSPAEVTRPALAAVAGAVFVALPGVSMAAHLPLPPRDVFAISCALGAALTWWAARMAEHGGLADAPVGRDFGVVYPGYHSASNLRDDPDSLPRDGGALRTSPGAGPGDPYLRRAASDPTIAAAADDQRYAGVGGYADAGYGESRYRDGQYGDRESGATRYPNRTREDRMYADRPYPGRQYEDRQYEDHPYPERQPGGRPYEDRQPGERPYQDRQPGDRPRGVRPDRNSLYPDGQDQAGQYGDRPYGNRQYGDGQDEAGRYGDRPYGDPQYGDGDPYDDPGYR